MRQEYDVIIVGAGPAGCSAAIFLARLGYDVLLMDKAKFPRDKVCGDGLGPLALEVLDRLGVSQQVRDRNPWVVEGIDFFSPAGQKVQAPLFHLEGRYKHGWVFPRRELDFLLWQHARSSSHVQVLENCEGRELFYDGQRVAGVKANWGCSQLRFSGRAVLGADGAYSRLSKRFFPPRQDFRNYAFAVRAYFRRVEGLTHQIEIHCEKPLLPGYGWVFPTGEQSANVGVGIASRFLKNVDIKKVFQAFIGEIRSLNDRFRGAHFEEESFRGWLIPLGTFGRRRGKENVLLLGDAGGFADVLTGEGIYYALRGGECAAEAVHGGLSIPGGIEKIGKIYEKLWRKAFDAKEYVIGSLLQRLVMGEIFLNLNIRRAHKNPAMARNLASILCHQLSKIRLLF